MELEAKVMLMTVDGAGADSKRIYQVLKLERHSVYFFPLTWTVVHPIDTKSPLYGKTGADLEKVQAEVLILIKGYDDTFSQTVHARYSYRYEEIAWGARFSPAFHVEEEGDLVLEINNVAELAAAESPTSAAGGIDFHLVAAGRRLVSLAIPTTAVARPAASVMPALRAAAVCEAMQCRRWLLALTAR
jgi:inward rectifier potassium channel